MKNPAPLHYELHGTIQELPAFFERLDAWAQADMLPLGLAPRLGLMMDELLTNVAMHAYDGQGGPVSIRVDFMPPHTLQSVIRDHGPAFDPTGLPTPDTALCLEERKVGGLGVHFVRKLADRFTYRRDGDCNEVTLSLSSAGK